jgi:hypothetical protein
MEPQPATHLRTPPDPAVRSVVAVDTTTSSNSSGIESLRCRMSTSNARASVVLSCSSSSRVTGRCSDTSDAVVWAAGGHEHRLATGSVWHGTVTGTDDERARIESVLVFTDEAVRPALRGWLLQTGTRRCRRHVCVIRQLLILTYRDRYCRPRALPSGQVLSLYTSSDRSAPHVRVARRCTMRRLGALVSECDSCRPGCL